MQAAGLACTVFTGALTCVRSSYFSLAIDALVVLNALEIGLEVDMDGAAFEPVRISFSCIYAFEILLRCLDRADRKLKNWFWRPALVDVFDILVVGVAQIDIVNRTSTWFWKSTLLRSLRLLRVYRLAERWRPLSDLWLVMAGLARAIKALAYLSVVLAVALFTGSVAVIGFINFSGHAEHHGGLHCWGTNSHDCFDVDEHFGSVLRSALTLLQLVTLDCWASHIVRPLFSPHPAAAVAASIFTFIVAYGLLSVAVGVLVWSTVALARSHGDHDTIRALQEEHEIIQILCDHFNATLSIEQRITLGIVDMQEALLIPQIASALNELKLPVANLKELFLHLDKDRQGAISMTAFEQGLRTLKQSATRFDVACLSANIEGSAAFTSKLSTKANITDNGLSALRATLASAFAVVEEVAAERSNDPVALLRRSGRIQCGVTIP